ncbi:hypothetical protein EDB83DRAFT_2451578 [Lactarius deliciosus]|nr:hypothetical protein EDB83DRAFT_2451578 [Lactarius deliciosus]
MASLPCECRFSSARLTGSTCDEVTSRPCGLPFLRPDDFFAEQMHTWSASTGICSTRLESACIAKNEARWRECEDKRIGKQVQLKKIKQKDMEEQLKRLKPSAPFVYIPLKTNPMQTRRLTQLYNDHSELQPIVQLTFSLTYSLRLPLPVLWDCAHS